MTGGANLTPASVRTEAVRSHRRGLAQPAPSSPRGRFSASGDRIRRLLAHLAHPVPAAMMAAASLHLLWVVLLANSGGDLAAQDAWAAFAREHPESAYNLAWYGGLHPVSYSVLAPYLMAALGVRTTMVLAGTVSAGLLALLLVKSNRLQRPLVPALYGAFALAGNAVSGRATFGLGMMFGLAGLAVIFAWPDRWRLDSVWSRTARGVAAGVLTALATASSPVAGLFLGIAAAAMWLTGRRAAAYTIGLPPVAVVFLSSWLFPFSGEQPMDTVSLILPCLAGVFVTVLAPRSWRLVRIGSGLYVAATLLAWLIPSPIGTNMTRLGLLFGGVVLIAVACRKPKQGPPALAQLLGADRATKILILAITTLSIWQVAFAVNDAVHSKPTESWTAQLEPLVRQLESRDAELGRVEVVPARSHREASALAPYVNLARGWNRQADAELNPIFYDDDLLNPASYRTWLDRWAVRYVVLPTGPPDYAADEEAALVAGGLPYLRDVWADPYWRLYEVVEPTPLAEPPAEVISFDANELVLSVSSPGAVLVRIPYSPWLSLVDSQGDALEAPESDASGVTPVNANGCLSELEQTTGAGQPEDEWTLLHAPATGIYRIAAPYKLPRGTTCPADMIP
ncbi:MAG: MFS transporter [Nocardioidaceae bacterium]